jgi:hypothetical protein
MVNSTKKIYKITLTFAYNVFSLAPKVFTMLFAMVKPFLHQITLEKISVFGFDKKEWSAALLKEIDADQLPVQYGGTMSKVNLIFNF